MVKQKGIEWKQEYSKEAAIRRHDHRNCPIRSELATNVTYRALNLLRDQFIMAFSARLGTHDLGNCTGAFTAQYGLPCKHIIFNFLKVKTSESGARTIIATRPLRLQDVCKYWRLPHRLEDVDPLLAEIDPRVVAYKGRPRNAPEEGIVPPSGTVIRRSVEQHSWRREPSSHQYLERSIQPSGRRALQTEGRVARELARDGFAVVNSQESNAREGNDGQEKLAVRGGSSRGRGAIKGRRRRHQPYEGMGIIDFSS